MDTCKQCSSKCTGSLPAAQLCQLQRFAAHPITSMLSSQDKQANTLQEKGKCAVIPSVGTPDEVFKHVTDAIHEHMPHLPEHATATPVAKATQDEVAPVDATPAPVAAAEEDKTREATEAAVRACCF